MGAKAPITLKIMKFEKVINGIVKYIDAEIYPAMNDWQEIMARVAVSRMLNSSEAMKRTLATNGFLRTFAIIDEEGNIDSDGLIDTLREQVAQKGKVTLSLPLMPRLAFTASDVDNLKKYITEN